MLLKVKYHHLALLLACFFSTSFAAEKKTICLNMIVKNENHVIKRCLESVLPIIDTWVILDTGSTDGTQQTIKEFMKGIPGELHESPFTNFGDSRQKALDFAKNKADYILFMDADDELQLAEGFKLPNLVEDFYMTGGDFPVDQFWLPRLIRADLDWAWVGVIHEYLKVPENTHWAPFEGVKYIYHHDGARGKDKELYKKDQAVLLQAIKDDPTNPRYYFYLARAYWGSNDLELALEYFEKRANMEGLLEEIFISKLSVGEVQYLLKQDPKIVQDSLFKAHLTLPYRLEPIYYIAKSLREEEKFEEAYKVALLGLDLPADPKDFMIKESWIYNFGMLSEFAYCAALTERFDESIKICKNLLEQTVLPQEVKGDVETCYEYARTKKLQQIQTKLLSMGF